MLDELLELKIIEHTLDKLQIQLAVLEDQLGAIRVEVRKMIDEVVERRGEEWNS